MGPNYQGRVTAEDVTPAGSTPPCPKAACTEPAAGCVLRQRRAHAPQRVRLSADGTRLTVRLGTWLMCAVGLCCPLDSRAPRQWRAGASILRARTQGGC